LRGSSTDIDQRAHHVPPGAHADPDKLHVRVRLSALLKDGVTVTSAGHDLGISTPRRGVGAIWHRYRGPRLSDDPATEAEMLNRSYRVGRADIEDAINQMLGRDAELHRPPRLSWGQLIDALADAGVTATEQELIAAPLTVELTPEVQAQLSEAAP
jgi:hypothetical protein